MAPGAAVPGSIGLHVVLAAPDVSRWRFLEVSRDPPFVRRAGVDLGGALPSGESYPRNHSGRRHIADGGYLAQRHALGRALHHVPFGVRSRQSELDAWSVKICAGNADLPSLASHRA